MKNPNTEGLKEVLRLFIIFALSSVVSYFISETLKQVELVPQYFTFKIWVFTYPVPIRGLFTLILTGLGRYLDKYVFVNNKLTKGYGPSETPKGILPF